MAKVKLIYEKRAFDIKKDDNIYGGHSCNRITDMAIPIELYKQGIEVIKQKVWGANGILLVLKSKDKKKFLKCKILTILDRIFSGKVNILLLQ